MLYASLWNLPNHGTESIESGMHLILEFLPQCFTAQLIKTDHPVTKNAKVCGRLKEDQTIWHCGHETGLTKLSTVRYTGILILVPWIITAFWIITAISLHHCKPSSPLGKPISWAEYSRVPNRRHQFEGVMFAQARPSHMSWCHLSFTDWPWRWRWMVSTTMQIMKMFMGSPMNENQGSVAQSCPEMYLEDRCKE